MAVAGNGSRYGAQRAGASRQQIVRHGYSIPETALKGEGSVSVRCIRQRTATLTENPLGPAQEWKCLRNPEGRALLFQRLVCSTYTAAVSGNRTDLSAPPFLLRNANIAVEKLSLNLYKGRDRDGIDFVDHTESSSETGAQGLADGRHRPVEYEGVAFQFFPNPGSGLLAAHPSGDFLCAGSQVCCPQV